MPHTICPSWTTVPSKHVHIRLPGHSELPLGLIVSFLVQKTAGWCRSVPATLNQWWWMNGCMDIQTDWWSSFIYMNLHLDKLLTKMLSLRLKLACITVQKLSHCIANINTIQCITIMNKNFFCICIYFFHTHLKHIFFSKQVIQQFIILSKVEKKISDGEHY